MTIDPTARYTNIRARVTGYLTGLTVSGSPSWVTELGQPVGATRWARITYVPIRETWAGRYTGSQIVADSRILVVIDLFYEQADTGASVDLYAVDRAADDVAHGLRSLALSLLDYSSTPAAPTTVSGARIFVVEPPTITRLDPSGGRARRQVSAELRWYLRHAA